MKLKKKEVVDYNSKKLLSRLFILANSKLNEKCLMTFDKNVDLEYSKKFYYLLLECFENWGKNYGMVPKYKDFQTKLFKIKKLPIPEKFYNYPNEYDNFQNEILEDLNNENEDFSEFKKEIDSLKRLRVGVVEKIIENPSANLNRKKQLGSMVNFYEENLNSLKNNPLKDKLQNDRSVKAQELVEDTNREFFFF